MGFVGKDPNEIADFFNSQVGSFIIQGRAVAVKQFPDITSAGDIGTTENEELRKCHIVFISADAKNNIEGILMSLEGKNVLTAGETESFPSFGGMVAFVTENNRVKIHVNLNAVDKANIKISAQFLQHAKIVKSDKKTGRSIDEGTQLVSAKVFTDSF